MYTVTIVMLLYITSSPMLPPALLQYHGVEKKTVKHHHNSTMLIQTSGVNTYVQYFYIRSPPLFHHIVVTQDLSRTKTWAGPKCHRILALDSPRGQIPAPTPQQQKGRQNKPKKLVPPPTCPTCSFQQKPSSLQGISASHHFYKFFFPGPKPARTIDWRSARQCQQHRVTGLLPAASLALLYEP